MISFTEDLVSAVLRSGLIPTSQNTFVNPDDFIAFMNEEQLTKIVPAIMANRADYFLTYSIVPLVSGIQAYQIPRRAIANTLKDFFYLPNSSDLTTSTTLGKISVHDVPEYTDTNTFYVNSDNVVIMRRTNSVSSAEALQMFFYRRPSSLIATSSCAKITGISSVSGTTTFTVDTDLTSSLSVGGLIDVIDARSPLVSWADDVAITAITSTTIAVATSSVSNAAGVVEPQLNDYLCPAGFTCIPNVPQEFFPIYSELAVARCLRALGAAQNLQIVQASIKEMFLALFGLTANRVESSVDTVYDKSGIINALGSYGQRMSIR